MQSNQTDDALTLAALGILAFVIADLGHEAMGHGLMTLVVGAKPILLTSSYFVSSESTSRWIPAAGGIANFIIGGVSWILLRTNKTISPLLRYFWILCVAFNLLFASGYPAYSGIALFGDWAGVISGLSPAWVWRAMLVLVGVSGYFFTMRLLAVEIRPFCAGLGDGAARARLRRMTLIPYCAAIIAAFLAGALNPRGLSNVFTAALPAAAGSFGLTQLDHLISPGSSASSSPVAGPVGRDYAWIAAASIALALFIGMLGPGIRFHAQ